MIGLAFAPAKDSIEWTKDNHYRLRQSYRIYKWDAAKGQVVLARDWFGYKVN